MTHISIIESSLSIDINNEEKETKKLRINDINWDNEINKKKEKIDNNIVYEKTDKSTINESNRKKEMTKRIYSKIKRSNNNSQLKKKRYNTVDKNKESEELYFSIENVRPLLIKNFIIIIKIAIYEPNILKKLTRVNIYFFIVVKEQMDVFVQLNITKKKKMDYL